MLILGFENSDVCYGLHSQCLTRIIKNDDILLTTYDYQSWDEEFDENNDFIYNVEKFKSEIEGGLVKSVDVNALFDVTITLDNDVTIQVINDNGYPHYDGENEKYRFFECVLEDGTDEPKLPPHYVVFIKRIEVQSDDDD